MSYQELREKYPQFIYSKYQHVVTPQGLELRFEYSLPPDLSFVHTVVIEKITPAQIETIPPDELENYIFSLGMVELLSYWKATAAPTIDIQAGTLTPLQIAWWKKLFLGGMGEYFFVNQIPFTQENFLTITNSAVQDQTVESTTTNTAIPAQDTFKTPVIPDISNPSILIPIGGGKDSAVTLTLLQEKYPAQIGVLLVNSIQAAKNTVSASGVTSVHTVTRTLDPQLLALKNQGYLNGHIPFSAVLAFISVLVGRLEGYTHVALSNERSSNEGNVFYCDQEVNHQYSKTFTFEYDFVSYTQTYFSAHTPHYFSFLRPLFELQIAQLFAPLEHYHAVFRSCNRGQKTNSWCGECPKCLFAYTLLLPFIGPEKMAHLFGKNLLADTTLLPIARELLGRGTQKPFECVGTREETLCAFHLCTQTYTRLKQPLPPLLETVQTTILAQESDLDGRAATVLSSWNPTHLIPPTLEAVLKGKIHANPT
jgi:UDP-N-acetyl-alpha-D-muramoyl-L-alanyl-L-glutamate epimerase